MPRNRIEPTSFDIHELTRRTGIDARTVRRYTKRGLIPAADFAGKNTRYGREHLVRLLALRKLSERTVRLDALRDELAKRTFEELEALAGLAPSKPLPPPATTPVAIASSVPLTAGDRWLHVTLLPSLVLMVRDGAPEMVGRVADEIRRKYSVES